MLLLSFFICEAKLEHAIDELRQKCKDFNLTELIAIAIERRIAPHVIRKQSNSNHPYTV
jgi:hypothetical protein